MDLTRRDRVLVRYWCDLIQVCILLFLFGVYMVAPQASGAKMVINPVPAIVALFIAATVLRLFLNTRQIGFRHIQYLWIVVDFACLYALLIAYHVQYQTGAGAILKATTADMIFLLIAVRALQFDERMVLAAGAAAAIGWIGLTGYAVAAAGTASITRNFVTYLTSDNILIGAQTERLIAIVLVTAALSWVVRQSRRDALTGLGDRTWLLNRQIAHRRTLHGDRGQAVFLVEIDDIHAVCSVFGTDIAVAIIRDVASRLRRLRWQRCRIAHIDRATFAIWHEDVSSEATASQLADVLRAAMNAPVVVGDISVPIQVFMGAVHRENDADPDEMLSDAIVALNLSKTQAARKTVFYSADIRSAVADRIALESDLKADFEAGGLSLHYQPIVRMSDKCVIGAEALLRWDSGKRGPVPPSQFIEIAERSGLIVDIGAWVVAQAAADARAWRDAGADMFVSVNVAGPQIDEWHALRAAVDAVEKDEIPLKIELTEGTIYDRSTSIVRRIRALCERKVTIAIDDFGTGYSSYAQLTNLPVSTIKVDRSISDQVDDERGRAVLQSIRTLARGFGADVVAEGVETEEAHQALRRIGVDYGQGFLYARPMPQSAFLIYLNGASTLDIRPKGAVVTPLPLAAAS